MEINKIYNEDCLETMSRMPDNYIDLVVTSPPYYNARQYSQYASYSEYIENIVYVFKKLKRVMKDSAILAVNISCVITPRESRNKESVRHPIPFDIGSRLSTIFRFIDDIIWIKPDGASNRGIKFSHHRKPVAYKTFNVTEYILIFANGNSLLDKAIQSRESEDVQDSLVLGEYERTNVWSISPQRQKGHPAPFPEELVEKIIKYYSYKNDLVYDPFMGSGTTAKMAILNNRNYIGSEISDEYCQIIEERIRMAKATKYGLCHKKTRRFRRAIDGG